MQQSIKNIFLLFSAATILIGCQSTKNLTSAEIAKSLAITYPAGAEIKSSYSFRIMIENNSDYCIDFSPNYNMTINVNVEGKWIQPSNMVIIFGDKPDILLPEGDPGSIDFFTAQPDLSDYKISKVSEAYVLISGHLCDDENFIIEKEIPFTIIP